MEKKEVAGLFIRLLITIIILLIPINLFQELLQEITLKATIFLLEISNLSPIVGKYAVKNSIEIFGTTTINIVKYCVTSSAYYLLLILAIITKNIPIIKRVFMFLIGSLLIFIVNMARIIGLIIILLKSPESFYIAHTILFIIISTVYVLIIWIALSIMFKIKTIPIYSDLKDLIKNE